MKHFIQILNLKITFFVVFITAALAGTSNLNAQVFDTIPSILFENQAQIDSFPFYYPFENIVVDGDVEFLLGREFENTDSLYNIIRISGDFIGNVTVTDPAFTRINGSINLPKLEYVRNFLPPVGSYALKLPSLHTVEDVLEVGKMRYDGDPVIVGVDLFSFEIPQLKTVNEFKFIGVEFNEDTLDLSVLEDSIFSLELQETNIEFLNLYDSLKFGRVLLGGNFQLKSCFIPALCNHAESDKYMGLGGNPIGCNSKDEIIFNCNDDDTCPPDSILMICFQADLDNFKTNYPNCTKLNKISIEGPAFCSSSADSITNLSGLSNITEVTGNFLLGYTECKDFSELNSLEKVGGFFWIHNNRELASCNGLENLQEVGDFFWLTQNADNGFDSLVIPSLEKCGSIMLSDINANIAKLPKLKETKNFNIDTSPLLDSLLLNDSLIIREGLYIYFSGLSYCAYNPFCNFIASGGQATIENNAPGCNSVDEIMLDCGIVSFSTPIGLDNHHLITHFYSSASDIFVITENNSITFLSKLVSNNNIDWSMELSGFTSDNISMSWNETNGTIVISDGVLLKEFTSDGVEINVLDISELIGPTTDLNEEGLLYWDLIFLDSGESFIHKKSHSIDSIMAGGSSYFGSRFVLDELISINLETLDTLSYSSDEKEYIYLSPSGVPLKETFDNGYYYDNPTIMCNAFVINEYSEESYSSGVERIYSSKLYDAEGNLLDDYSKTNFGFNGTQVPNITSRNGKVFRQLLTDDAVDYYLQDTCAFMNVGGVENLLQTQAIEVADEVYLIGRYIVRCGDIIFELEKNGNSDLHKMYSYMVDNNTIYGIEQIDDQIVLNQLVMPSGFITDQDGDGVPLIEDCDDTNPDQNYCTSEIPLDGIDNDCTESTPDDPDLDMDGFVLSIDCDDDNPDVNPDALEILYDGIDNDCNETTLDDDLDQDGYFLVDDCDDTNPAINPEAIEIPNNGIDEDCDGEDLISSVSELKDIGVTVYPNPFNEVLFLESSFHLDLKVRILSAEGKIIDTKFIKNGSYQFDLARLSSGIYLMELINDNTRVFYKIVKK